MRSSFTAPSTRRDRRFLPTLEALEARWCPSSGIFQHGHTLVIQGDGANDTISVKDNGQGGVSASITLANGTKTKTAIGITKLVINAGGGNDTIGYGLTGAMTQTEKLVLSLGQGSTKASLDFSEGLANARLAVKILGGRGSDQLTTQFGAITGSRVNLTEFLGQAGATSRVNFGGVLSGSDATVTVNGGASNDHVFAQVGDASNSNLQFLTHLGKGANSFDMEGTGSLQNAVVHFDVDGGSGGNTIAFNANGVNVDATSRLNLETCFGAGNDSVTLNYSGLMDGELDGLMQTGAGNDTVTVNVTLAQGSTGRVDVHADGGLGDDTMTMNVYDQSNPGGPSTLALLEAVLNGGLGQNVLSATPNVTVHK
jgi:hypothetical protein